MADQVYSFLLIGQSNMAGRGYMNEVEPIKNENLYVLRNGRWVQMFVPLHWERPMAGVLWHQGEADCMPGRYPLYEEKCTAIFEAFRRELGLSDEVPFLVGGLGEFLKYRDVSPFLVNYPHVNAHLQSMEAHQPYIHYVPAEGIPSNPDNLHFSAAGLREFGRRYFTVFEQHNRIIPVGEDAGAALEMTEMEKL